MIDSMRQLEAPSRKSAPREPRRPSPRRARRHASAAVDEVHAEEAAVRDRPGVGDGEPARAGPAADDPADPVPDDARPELGELVGRIAAGEHVEDVLERALEQVRERVRAAHERVELVDRDLLVGADGDDLLRERRRAGSSGCASPRSRPPASPARRRPTRAGRRGTSGRSAPSRRRSSVCPARPTRCRPRATDFGLSTCTTRSTAPMSMPSSSDEVATRHGILPAFSSSSIWTAARARASRGARGRAPPRRAR